MATATKKQAPKAPQTPAFSRECPLNDQQKTALSKWKLEQLRSEIRSRLDDDVLVATIAREMQLPTPRWDREALEQLSTSQLKRLGDLSGIQVSGRNKAAMIDSLLALGTGQNIAMPKEMQALAPKV